MSESKETKSNMPMAECPHCGKEWQWDDYYNLIPYHSSRECPGCKKEIYVLDIETVMWVRLSTEKP
jgi:endogenous inhibitor of DNA gyrase (YacG/DUF329 family)